MNGLEVKLPKDITNLLDIKKYTHNIPEHDYTFKLGKAPYKITKEWFKIVTEKFFSPLLYTDLNKDIIRCILTELENHDDYIKCIRKLNNLKRVFLRLDSIIKPNITIATNLNISWLLNTWLIFSENYDGYKIQSVNYNDNNTVTLTCYMYYQPTQVEYKDTVKFICATDKSFIRSNDIYNYIIRAKEVTYGT